MADKTNGTTLAFPDPTAVNKLRDIGFTKNGARVDTTDLADTLTQFEIGTSEVNINVTVVGTTTLDVGDEGTGTITWTDATEDAITNAVVSDFETSGSLNSEILTTITLTNTPA